MRLLLPTHLLDPQLPLPHLPRAHRRALATPCQAHRVRQARHARAQALTLALARTLTLSLPRNPKPNPAP